VSVMRTVVVLVISVAAAVGSYVATQAWQQPSASPAAAEARPSATLPCDVTTCYRALAGWLGLSKEQTKQLEAVDSGFMEECSRMEDSLFAEREKLAELFDDPRAGEDAILKQVDRVIAANGALERRVAAHLVALRPYLTSEQRARLYTRCAKGIREACGCGRQQRWRCGKMGGATTCEALCSQPCEGKPAGKGNPSPQGPAEHGRQRHGQGWKE
jgi:hypothetical protein